MTTDTLKILKYAFDSENPVVAVTAVLIIAFLLFVTARRFFTTDYIKENKESREQLKQLNEALIKECERLKITNESYQLKIERLQTEKENMKEIDDQE